MTHSVPESTWRPPTRARRRHDPDGDVTRDAGSFIDARAALEALPSAASIKLRDKLGKLSRHAVAPILLEGEAGVGKTLLARAVHQLSPRADKQFLSVDLTTLRGELALSALFGHVRGAFTGADRDRGGAFGTAHHGTLFLDELTKAERGVQAVLLGVVEYGLLRPLGADRALQVDVRCVFATNRSLADCVARDEFLPDLAARLAHFAVRIPPVRERMADVPVLVDRAVQQATRHLSLPHAPRVSDELLDILMRHRWPDNVREIFGSVARIMAEAAGESVLRPSHIPDESALAALRGRRRKIRLVRGAAASALDAAGGNKSEAARLAQCHRSTIYRRLQQEDAGR